MERNPDQDQVVVEEKINKTNGETVNISYQKGKYLGKGGFARVYEFCQTETRKVTAAKVIPKSNLTRSSARKKLMSEIKIHRSLHHNNIVGFEHYFEDAENVYILLEICPNQTMNELLKRRKRLTEIEVQCYLLQIISGLNYLHGRKIVHRDLKLGNFFISEKMEIKLGDFGLAAVIRHEGEKRKTICGTPNYIAPEVLDGNGHSYEVDIWAVGIVAYTLLVGKPPFETSEVRTTYRRIKMNAFSYPENVNISEVSKDLINRILITDPSSRLSLTQILNHDFFHQANTIPKLLPPATLACPPTLTFLKLYLPAQLNQTTNSSRIIDNTHNISKNSPRALREEVANAERTNRKEEAEKTSRSPQSQITEVSVIKWVDYSNKYGLGYLLSNGATGVLFNDATKILHSNKSEKFKYFQRKDGEKVDSCEVHSLADPPKDLQKKVTLLNHFKNYLEGEGKKEDFETTGTEDTVHVKKWIKTKHAILFRLSNKIVQVKFQDHTEIVLSSETRMVSYINKKHEKAVFQLANALESNNNEMTKRLKYTKELLASMLKNNQNNDRDS